MHFVRALQRIDGRGDRPDRGDGCLDAIRRAAPRQGLPAAELVDGEPLLRRVRRVKSAEEIDAIGASVRLAELALGEATAALAPGVTERQLTGVFMEAMARQE